MLSSKRIGIASEKILTAQGYMALRDRNIRTMHAAVMPSGPITAICLVKVCAKAPLA